MERQELRKKEQRFAVYIPTAPLRESVAEWCAIRPESVHRRSIPTHLQNLFAAISNDENSRKKIDIRRTQAGFVVDSLSVAKGTRAVFGHNRMRYSLRANSDTELKRLAEGSCGMRPTSLSFVRARAAAFGVKEGCFSDPAMLRVFPPGNDSCRLNNRRWAASIAE